MRRFIAVFVAVVLSLPALSFAVTKEELMRKIQDMSRQIEQLKQQTEDLKKEEVKKEERITKVEEKAEQAAWASWLEIGGDYRFRFDSLKGKVHDYYRFEDVLGWMLGAPPPSLISGYTVKNDALLTNRFGLNLKVNATEDINVRARLLMYKVWGHQTEGPVMGNFFADRAFGTFDGTVAHVPEDSILRVDYAFATWSHIGGAPVWFSIGRRPSTEGPPMYLRQNTERISTTAGVIGTLVNYAFDGLTIGAAPDIPSLPGAFVKLCYGKGFDSGYRGIPGQATLKDVNFAGISVVPYSTDKFHIELQANKGFDIFDNMPDAGVRTNLGDIDQFGGLVMGTLHDVGPGDLNLFLSAALSKTHPTDNLFMVDTNDDGVPDMGVAGLLYDAPALGGEKKDHTGNVIYLGARYDIKSTKTKIGAEYNRGSKYWITFTPAADDLWTSKLGTRGSVYELYLIQELGQIPIAKRGKAFVRLGYQYYKFKYTGSNSWIGKPKDIGTLANPMNAQMLAPIKNAQNIYVTFDVLF